MSISEDFFAALNQLESTAPAAEMLPGRLAVASTRVLPVAGAGISMFADANFRIPVGASDDNAATAERSQSTIGEGPCIHAHHTAATVLAPEALLADRWPQFYDQLVTRTPYRAVTSVPLRGVLTGIGALDLFHRRSEDLAQLDLTAVEAVATHITTALLSADLLPDPDFGPVWSNSPSSEPRSWVLIAMGMISVSLDTSTDDALAMLRAHAFTQNITVDETAQEVVERRLAPHMLAGNE